MTFMYPIEKQRVKIYIKIDRATETLNQCDWLGVSRGFFVTGIFTMYVAIDKQNCHEHFAWHAMR